MAKSPTKSAAPKVAAKPKTRAAKAEKALVQATPAEIAAAHEVESAPLPARKAATKEQFSEADHAARRALSGF
jgi:hypothetical protein